MARLRLAGRGIGLGGLGIRLPGHLCLGEEQAEIEQTLRDIASDKTDILTIGQYLQPTRDHLPVERWYPPDEFDQLAEEAYSRGFKWVESAPLVRSSYHADGQARIIPPRNPASA